MQMILGKNSLPPDIDTTGFATLEDIDKQVKSCATHMGKLFDPEEFKVFPSTINRLFIGKLKVQYFKINTFGREAPLNIKFIEDEICRRKSGLLVYISFNNVKPDSESNDGVFSSGRIKIDPQRRTRVFTCDTCYFAALSMFDCSYCIAYYFNNEPPIHFSMDKELAINKIAEQGNLPIRVERDPEKWLSMETRINNYVNKCIEDKEEFQNLEDKTKEILASRDRNFVENRRKLEYKHMYVQQYYDKIIPAGVPLEQFKVDMCKQRK